MCLYCTSIMHFNSPMPMRIYMSGTEAGVFGFTLAFAFRFKKKTWNVVVNLAALNNSFALSGLTFLERVTHVWLSRHFGWTKQKCEAISHELHLNLCSFADSQWYETQCVWPQQQFRQRENFWPLADDQLLVTAPHYSTVNHPRYTNG